MMEIYAVTVIIYKLAYYVLSITLTFTLAIIIFRSIRNYFTFRDFPQEPGNFFFGDLFKIIPLNPFTADFGLKVQERGMYYLNRYIFNKRKLDDLIVGWYGWLPIVVFLTHKSIEELNSKPVLKKLFLKKFIPLKDGLLSSDAPKWKHRRKIIEPFFTSKALTSYVSVVNEIYTQFVADLDKRAKSSVDLLQPIQAATLDIIIDLSTHTPWNEHKIGKSVVLETLSFAAQKMVKIISNPAYWVDAIFHRTSIGRQYDELMLKTEKFLNQIIQSRHEQIYAQKAENKSESSSVHSNRENKRVDLLELLSPHFLSNSIDMEGLNEELLTMILAGHETVATGLVWLLLCLGNHHDIQQRLYEEIAHYFPEDSPIDDIDKLNSLVYLEQCIKEGLRLYPSLPAYFRQLEENRNINGYDIPKGTYIIIPSLVAQRDPTVYPNPEQYDPERFSPENISSIPKYAFIPFGLAPRFCIGYRLAYLEMKIFLIHLLRKYHVNALKKMEQVSFKPQITLNPSCPIELKLTERMKEVDKLK